MQALAAAPDGATVRGGVQGRAACPWWTLGRQRRDRAGGIADGPVTGLAFSPDSAWLAVVAPRSAAAAEPDPPGPAGGCGDSWISPMARFSDTEPVFSKDGLYLAFLSRRSFDPIYDAHFFDHVLPVWVPAVPG